MTGFSPAFANVIWPFNGSTGRPYGHFWPGFGPPQEIDRMAKNQAVWALDIGQSALKGLKLAPGESPDQVVAEAFDFVEYPKILSQPDADPEALVSEALGTFLDRNDLKGCKVAIAVPGQAGLVKFIKLPPVEKKRIPDIVKFEAKQQIPFALEEVVWAYQQIGDKDEEADDEDFANVEVGLFAMKRDQINRAIAPFRSAGIEIDVVQMGPIALYNYITYDQLKGTDLKGSIVLLDIGADNTDLIISDGTRIWSRNVPIGGNHFTRALTKELKLTFAKAEHLKRNATKAPDPKAVFTAMRGIFNDFASEVNRSIGFYSSVNRQAKIIKVVGLGNGFKLPGLQKFLQQNLNGLEVEKLESFNKLTNDEVKDAPQFVENLPSFAVSYGLALQGLGRSQLKTNLLPPEVEQVRILRRKKPWALAASALLMLGFAGMYMGDYKAYSKVVNEPFKAAVDKVKSVSGQGSNYANAYNTTKTEFEAKLKEGKALIIPDDQRASWAKFLQLVNDHLPDPAAEYNLNPANPNDMKVLDKLRVHIDRIKPVFRTDVAAGWFNDPKAFPEDFKATLHPYDRPGGKELPAGEGWIVQIVGHHYNPYPTMEERNLPENQRKWFGPYDFITHKVLPKLQSADLRALGVHHAAMTWKINDPGWTSEKGSVGAGTVAPLLDRAAPTAAAGATPGATPGADPRSGGGEFGKPNSALGGLMMPTGGGFDPRMQGGGMYGGGVGANKKNQNPVVTQTRTDFLIQFIWQPPTPEKPAKPIEEIRKALVEAETDPKNLEAIRAFDSLKIEKKLQEVSEKGSEAVIAKENEAAKAAGQISAGPIPSNGAAPAGNPIPPVAPPPGPQGAR
jgi:type IV pilus assembly protein PilM